MTTYLIQSPDELNQIEVTGDTLESAIENGMNTSFSVSSFFDEYKLADCYIEEIKE